MSGERIGGLRPRQNLQPLEQVQGTLQTGGTGAAKAAPVLGETPLPSKAAEASKKLGASLELVLTRTNEGLAAATKDLTAPKPKVAQTYSRLRALQKQLAQLSPEQLGPEHRGSLLAQRAEVMRLREAMPRNTQDRQLIEPLVAAIDQRAAELIAPQLVSELASFSPTPAGKIDALLSGAQDAQKIPRQLGRMYPGADAFGGTEVLASRLTSDLGPLKEDLTSRMKERGLSDQDISRFFAAFAEVRQGYASGALSGDDMQRTNWIHTRTEILHTLESAKALDLSADQTLVALLGSLGSDAFKDASTFSLLWHNRAGAEVVLPLVMGRNFDLGQPRDRELLRQAMRVAHEHQITPPLFMTGAMKSLIGDAPGSKEILDAVNKPLAAPQSGGEIVFSSEARALLEKKGLPGWAVPEPGSANHQASQAAIVGDVLQYVSADGVLKIAVDIRDPGEQRPFMRDPLLKTAVTSSTGFSFGQGMSVIDDPALKSLAAEHQAAMTSTLEQKVYPEVERRLRQELKVPDGQPTPEIPYWNAPVQISWPEGTPPEEARLGASDRISVALVKKTFAAVMSEQGGVALDPFEHRARGLA